MSNRTLLMTSALLFGCALFAAAPALAQDADQDPPATAEVAPSEPSVPNVPAAAEATKPKNQPSADPQPQIKQEHAPQAMPEKTPERSNPVKAGQGAAPVHSASAEPPVSANSAQPVSPVVSSAAQRPNGAPTNTASAAPVGTPPVSRGEHASSPHDDMQDDDDENANSWTGGAKTVFDRMMQGVKSARQANRASITGPGGGLPPQAPGRTVPVSGPPISPAEPASVQPPAPVQVEQSRELFDGMDEEEQLEIPAFLRRQVN